MIPAPILPTCWTWQTLPLADVANCQFTECSIILSYQHGNWKSKRYDLAVEVPSQVDFTTYLKYHTGLRLDFLVEIFHLPGA